MVSLTSKNISGVITMKILILLISCIATVAFSPPRTTRINNPPCLTVRHLSSAPFSVGGPSEDLLQLFSRQVTQEFSASQLYLSASIWFDRREWEGMSAYMLAESAEERGHALEFVQFANKRNIPIELETILAPNSQWKEPEEVWADILKLEETNTANLLKVAEAANACQDYAVLAFLNPFHVSSACIMYHHALVYAAVLFLNLWAAACLVDSLSLIRFIQYLYEIADGTGRR